MHSKHRNALANISAAEYIWLNLKVIIESRYKKGTNDKREVHDEYWYSDFDSENLRYCPLQSTLLDHCS